MPKRNYGFEKRQKELNKQRKQEEKRQRKQQRADAEPRTDEVSTVIPPGDEPSKL